MNYLNISGYKFIALAADTLPALQQQLTQQATEHSLKGTILLSSEGINAFLAGAPADIHSFVDQLRAMPDFADIWFKFSESADIPFKHLRVRIKTEIIAMKQPEVQPQQMTAPYLEPAQLKEWYEQHQDMVILDTRNTYEVERGTFEQALHLNIENFNEFPAAIASLPAELKAKPIVTFCTGGIRCEKAAAYLLQQGFNNVWQLKGGILNYFEQCGGEYFDGDCFVFDERIAVDSNLHPAYSQNNP